MALLDMSKDKYMEVMVAHVNYHHRDTANRDEKIVKDYCKKYNIKFFKKDYVDTKGGNFQNKARLFRYKFFNELVNEYDLDYVLVAHHKDDLIETYLMQEDKKLDVSYYGLRKTNTLYGSTVKRPLLKYTKKQLEDYCIKNNIKYGIDESNLTNEYSRNKIRHEVIDNMSIKEKNELVKSINVINKTNELLLKNTKSFINNRTKIDVEEFNNYKDKTMLLREFIDINISKKHCEEIIRMIKDVKSFEIKIKNKYLCKEYGYLESYEAEKDYSYTLKDIKYLNKNHFKLSKKGNSKQGVTLKESDYPITIRNYKEGDSIKMRYGTKKINRFFIDNKISSRQRKMWPIMFNREGTAILVPEIGCDVDHFSTKHSVYMIEF